MDAVMRQTPNEAATMVAVSERNGPSWNEMIKTVPLH